MPPLAPGELLLLITDGMVEAHGADGALFGTDRLLDVVRTHQNQTARTIVDALYSAVRLYCGPQAQLDDMTVIIIKSLPSVETGCTGAQFQDDAATHGGPASLGSGNRAGQSGAI